MGWTAPRDWTDEELINAAIMNPHIRDNQKYLKGKDGVVTIESGLIIDNTDGDEYFQLPSLTTAERNALSAVNGMVIYNETTNALNAYQNSGWGLIGVTDHGALLGLADDDHTQYLLADGTRNLTGNLTVSASVTIDGIDISAHDIATTAVHGAGEYTLLHTGDVDDTPEDAATTAPVSSNWAYDHQTDDDVHDATAINVLKIGETPTYDDLQDVINTTMSAGRTSGGTISAHGDADGKVVVAAGTGFIKIEELSAISDTKFFDWSQTTLTTANIANNDTSYIYIDYNSGSPVPKATTDRTAIELNRQFTLGRVYRVDAVLHIINSGMNLPNHARLNHARLIEVRGFERATGGVISEDVETDRALRSSAGTFYLGANKITTVSQDTSTGHTFTYWYHIGEAWTSSTGNTVVSNTQYDAATQQNGDNLASIGTARYGVFWVFIHYDSDLHVVYGRDSYKLADAENALVPDLPDAVSEFSILAAKIIVLKDAPRFTSVASAYETLFPVSTPANHWDLGGLQGGTTDEYYHLTLSDYTELNGWLDNVTLGSAGAVTIGSDGSGADLLLYGGTASNSLTYDASENVLNILSTMKAADNVIEVLVTDATTLSSGRGRALHLGYTVSGTKTGTYGIRPVNIEMTISENVPSACGLNSYIAPISNKTVGNLFGGSIYLSDQGNAVSNLIGLDIGINSTNVASSRHTGMRIRNHSGTATAAITIEEAFTNTILRHSPSGVDLNLITLDNSSGAIFYWDDSEVKFRFNKGLYIDAACSVQGTWVATDTWTLPAITLGGTVTGGNNNLNNIGHIGLSNLPSYTNVGLAFDETLEVTEDTYASTLEIKGYNTSGEYVYYIQGGYFSAGVTNSNTQNWTATMSLMGAGFYIFVDSGTASTSTITGAVSLYVYTPFVGGSANDMVLTNYYGLYIGARTLVGNSKLTNDYGIYIGAQAGGSTLNYAIYTAGGSVYHVGDLTAANIITAGNVDGVDVSAHDVATTGVHGVGAETIIHSGDTIASLTADTLANYNTQVSDATLLDEGTVIAFAVALGG